MKAAPPRPPNNLRSHPAVRNGTTLCLGALLVLVVVLVEAGLQWWSLLPAVVGAGALLGHWTIGPPLVLVSLTGLLLSHSRHWMSFGLWSVPRPLAPTDFILCAAVLAYVIGHYRLLSLTRHVFPPDPRRRGVARAFLPVRTDTGKNARATPSRRRAAQLVTPQEITMLLLGCLFWTGLAVLLSLRLTMERPRLEFRPEVWRTLLVAWGFGLAIALVWVVTAYLRQAGAGPEESLLYLQDAVWRDTRREQSLVNRWMVWARLRRRSKKEQP